jgi:nickel-dependent lactate racemase
MDQITHTFRQTMWQDILLQCQNRPCRMSAKQWMIENNINEKSYYYWQRKFRKETFEKNSSDLMELAPLKTKEELSFVELTKPKNRINLDELNNTVHPAAILKTDFITITITNEISDSLLKRIIQEVSHA